VESNELLLEDIRRISAAHRCLYYLDLVLWRLEVIDTDGVDSYAWRMYVKHFLGYLR
jgi:hypothetical protein